MGHLLHLQDVLAARVREDTEPGVAHAVQNDAVLLIGGLPVLLVDRFFHGPGVAEAVHQEDAGISLRLLHLQDDLLRVGDPGPAR